MSDGCIVARGHRLRPCAVAFVLTLIYRDGVGEATLNRARRWWLRPPWRTVLPLLFGIGAALLAYAMWPPGASVTDGRLDRGRNGIWLQHGWLADDAWLARNGYTAEQFRNPQAIAQLVEQLRRHHITDLFPHVAPADGRGDLPPVDHEQVERFLDGCAGMNVLPWVGGVLGEQVHPDDPTWRRRFIERIVALLEAHPRLAGVHLNIEPCPSGYQPYLTLLDELRAAMPAGKRLSVAAYPPPTYWQPTLDVHWEQAYFRAVAERLDQMVVMLYDTAIDRPKVYVNTVKQWTVESLTWTEPTAVLLGLPAYEDQGVDYHDPSVENLHHALRGVHAGLLSWDRLPDLYQGIAIYSEWTVDALEWAELERAFLAD